MSILNVTQKIFFSLFLSTEPNPIRNLRILIFSTSSITLKWTEPQEYKEVYTYRVVTEGSPPPTNGNGNKTTNDNNVTVEGLTSGTNYSFSVTTLAEDGTPAESVDIANYTGNPLAFENQINCIELAFNVQNKKFVLI